MSIFLRLLHLLMRENACQALFLIHCCSILLHVVLRSVRTYPGLSVCTCWFKGEVGNDSVAFGVRRRNYRMHFMVKLGDELLQAVVVQDIQQVLQAIICVKCNVTVACNIRNSRTQSSTVVPPFQHRNGELTKNMLESIAPSHRALYSQHRSTRSKQHSAKSPNVVEKCSTRVQCCSAMPSYGECCDT
ncbi:hypothetical protein M5K25_012777 [Dendrobium thyrsiflorum]|uniref:Secreted protein n=1 Tax=Dendrobium thyrsiflorum TaxID=117978 RepID=A0ABD0V4Q3_DENTH